jgi:hypothetical protein
MLIFVVYKSSKYIEVIKLCTESTFVKAIDEVKALPNYSQDGEVME